MTQQWSSYLACCTEVILNDIKQGVSQKSLALTYAMAIVSDKEGMDRPDWERINQAIINKWSQSGLERIKKRAWKLIREKCEHSTVDRDSNRAAIKA